MTKGTVLVASPSAIGRQPEASGSSVPAWPARLAANSRFTTATAWVEVIPTGLSSTVQPCTSRLSCVCCFSFPSPASGRGEEKRVGSFIFAVVLVQVAPHRRRPQQLVNALGLIEALVQHEADVRR